MMLKITSPEKQMIRKPLYEPKVKANSSLRNQIEHSVEALSKMYPSMVFDGQQARRKERLPLMVHSTDVSPAIKTCKE